MKILHVKTTLDACEMDIQVAGLRGMMGGAGVLLPHGDDEALAEAIQELCENPELYYNVAIACQERAKQYNISVMAEQYNQLFQSLNEDSMG